MVLIFLLLAQDTGDCRMNPKSEFLKPIPDRKIPFFFFFNPMRIAAFRNVFRIDCHIEK